MKSLNLLLIILVFSVSSNFLFSQNLENESYMKSNRYVQNTNYNTDAQISLSVNNDRRSKLIQVNEEFAEFEINALYNAKADSYLAILSVIQNGSTAVAVDSMINIRYTGFCNDLSRFGIRKEEIFIDMIALVPVYDIQVEKKLFSKTYNEVPAGFKLQRNIHIYYEKAEVLDHILTIASKHEIYDLIKVEYFVKNTEAIYDSLINVSIEALNRKVKKLEKLGIVVDTLKHVFADQKNVFFPVDRYTPYNSYGGISLTNKETSSVGISKKTPTMFYNKIPYHNYDIIINPSFKEPAVQYTYNTLVRYYLKPDKKDVQEIKKIEKVKNIYHIVTPNGDIKKLNTD